ncbi:GNAT family N-acetyltransferase [Tsukamurella strandjordii]|uniref:GNAT family N-acetyltransferase n=1 Tax=Tsukamurella strandjordii TaxID=147577 RepID=A0AA90SQF8_9ACTN|nr:GNAT family N-acetyltransferase [Tsukamurella strandjordii]MDP0397836.1 GNAT family N-acetyltransferase [Tsukamurella strandjordii]
MGIELIAPRADLHEEWLRNVAEWGDTAHHPGAGSALARGLDRRDPAGFAAWVDRLAANATVERTSTVVPATNRWIVRGDRYLGAIQLRHELTEMLAELGGHIGYHVRPSERRKGVAGAALALMLAEAARLGLPEVLVTCDDDNIGSRRTVESAGGVLARIRPVDDYARAHGFTAPLCHYWIPTSLT